MRKNHLFAAAAFLLIGQPAFAASMHKHAAHVVKADTMTNGDMESHASIPQHTAIDELNQRSMARASQGAVLTRSEAEQVAIR